MRILIAHGLLKASTQTIRPVSVRRQKACDDWAGRLSFRVCASGVNDRCCRTYEAPSDYYGLFHGMGKRVPVAALHLAVWVMTRFLAIT